MTENQTLTFDLSRTFYSHQTNQEMPLNISVDHTKKVLQDKDNEMNKAISIKEYSNNFLRSMTCKPRAEPPCRKLNTQQRFNVILKKKNVLAKNQPKQSCSIFQQNFSEYQKNQALIRVTRLYNSRRDKVKTQASASNIENNLSQLQMDKSVFNLIAPNSNVLNYSAKSRFFDENHKQIEDKRNKSISIKKMQKKQKISQSRGLQLFSKIFVRNKDEIVQKNQKKINNHRTIVPKCHENEQNFQTRKITPIVKNKKAKILIETYRPKKRSLKKYYTIQNNQPQPQQFFELIGWETTI